MTSRPAADKAIKVLLVDDHTILRQGIHALLSREPDIEVVGEASDGLEALDQVARLEPQVVIMDLVMPHMNGLEATRQIRERHPDVRILILSMYDDDEYVREIIQAGASGYVLKRVATEDLVKAIHEVHQGSSFLYPPIAAKLIDYVRSVQGGDDVESLDAQGTRGPQAHCRGQHEPGHRQDPRLEQKDGRESPRQHHAQARSPRRDRSREVRHSQGADHARLNGDGGVQ